MKLPFALSLLLVATAVIAAEPDAPVDRSVVEVLVTAQRYDSHVPWRRERPSFKAGYGVVIAAGRIVTAEDLVRNAVLVEIRRPGQGAKTSARIVQTDARADAALLSVETEQGQDPLPPVEWDGSVSTGTKVKLVQFDSAGQTQTGEGRVTEVAVAPLPDAPHSILTFSVLTDLKLDRVGAPVFRNGRLVGLAVRYDEASQTSIVLPASVLKRFVEAASLLPYRGIATAGVFWTPLIDPVKRRYLGLAGEDRGVLVVRTVPESGAAGVLTADDVIIEWDGRTIDSQGYYNDAEFGRLSYSHLIAGYRRPGDTVPVTILRNGRSLDVQVRLDSFDDRRALIPLNTEGLQTGYLVEGGLVLRELTADYLQSFGARWMLTANPRLVNLYLTRAQFPDTPGQRVVILADIIPDLINKGYHGYRDEVVTRVNGQAIANLQDVFAIRKRDGGIWRVTTQSRGVDIVLDRAGLEEANRRIAERYRIPNLRFLPQERSW